MKSIAAIAEQNESTAGVGSELQPQLHCAAEQGEAARDRIMLDYAATYPGYGWEHNRGYPTPDHRRAINDLGLTPLHRRSFGQGRLAWATRT